MPDEIDRAQAAEAMHLQAALSRAHVWHGPAPTIIDGEAYCHDCGDIIPLARQLADGISFGRAGGVVGMCKQ